MPAAAPGYKGDGWYVCRVDTGVGTQFAVVKVARPSSAGDDWDPLDGLSDHHKGLETGPGVTPESAWAVWRMSLPGGNAFGMR